jgi:hypothetical protein
MTIPSSVYESGQVATDFALSKQQLDISTSIRSAMETGKKGLVSQLLEYARLSRAPGRLEMKDYYLYRLYDDSRLSFEDKRQFVSERFYFDIIKQCCDPRWWILADDKHWAYTVLAANGFPVPETQAVYCTSGRTFGSVTTLTNAEQLERFFANAARFPLYAKPNHGIGSFGNFLLDDFRAPELSLNDGKSMAIDAFISQLDAKNGQLFQSLLKPDAALEEFSSRVSTVRVILILRQGEPKIIHTVWKIPASRNIADNFWRVGNMLASVNLAKGTVERIVGHQNGVPEPLAQDHPLAKRLIGVQLPHWEEVLDLCLMGSKLFAPLKFQSWDIALSQRGPTVMEFNPGSAFNLSQLAEDRGFLNDEFYDFLIECGCKLKPLH